MKHHGREAIMRRPVLTLEEFWHHLDSGSAGDDGLGNGEGREPRRERSRGAEGESDDGSAHLDERNGIVPGAPTKSTAEFQSALDFAK